MGVRFFLALDARGVFFRDEDALGFFVFDAGVLLRDLRAEVLRAGVDPLEDELLPIRDERLERVGMDG